MKAHSILDSITTASPVTMLLISVVLVGGALPSSGYAQVNNAGFETGDYSGWTVINGTAWGDGPAEVRGHPHIHSWEGRYCANSYLSGEAATGVLRSEPFTLQSPIVFQMAGYTPELNYVTLNRVADNLELARVGAPGHGELRSYVLAAPGFIGEEMYIDIVDGDSGSSCSWLAVDFFVAAGESTSHACQSDTWVATDALGRTLPTYVDVGPPRPERFVGIFYFVWHGFHATQGPYDITSIQQEYPYTPGQSLAEYLDELDSGEHYGPFCSPDSPIVHHWGESLMGYYFATDSYVIRKHMQMLSDAGVDVLIIDNTNNVAYTANVLRLMSVCQDIRNAGGQTPQIAFLLYEDLADVARSDSPYNTIYQPGLFPDLWFRWRGKPLLLVRDRDGPPLDELDPEITDMFTVRESWAWSNPLGWFGDGHHKWPFLDHYPQAFGWDQDPALPEAMPVSIAQHASTNIGRSFHGGSQPPYGSAPTELGLCFSEQWNRVLAVDPEFVFITGWNEWITGRWEVGSPGFEEPTTFLGITRTAGQSVFVDEYNHEYSRDAEPVVGGHADNYYYQMIDYIRQFKGVSPAPAVTPPSVINIDGDFGDWDDVGPAFYDNIRDTPCRNDHPTFGPVNSYASYTNLSGRNDIVGAKITLDVNNLYFYVRTQAPLSTNTDTDWLVLYIDVDNDSSTGWVGYDVVVNRIGVGATQTTLEHNNGGGWNWAILGMVPYCASGCELEMAIPRQAIGETLSPVAFDFKWADNSQPEGDVLRFTTHGDSAPNGRFNYRYWHDLSRYAVCGDAYTYADFWIDLGSWTLEDALAEALAHGYDSLGIMPGTTDETLTISQPIEIKACGGLVTIGQ